MALFERVHLRSFAGATGWLNSEPLGPAELRGREWHLRNAFMKLGIHSRRELINALSSSGSEPITA